MRGCDTYVQAILRSIDDILKVLLLINTLYNILHDQALIYMPFMCDIYTSLMNSSNVML